MLTAAYCHTNASKEHAVYFVGFFSLYYFHIKRYLWLLLVHHIIQEVSAIRPLYNFCFIFIGANISLYTKWFKSFSLLFWYSVCTEGTKNSLLAIVVLDCSSYWQQMSADIDLLSIFSDRMRYKGKLSVMCVLSPQSQCPVLIKS